ncbi:5-formyltetrahydrofolate cyclo-ligase [uncultured Eubacterium sp.]|uniref:5-formyltetrahydrofolate cyclo-ligase n=1 Tax=uncultured Eubacterium sp. TaxID=165185 RepID=UPI0025DB73F1|nr:5-formyltetrahydrofolate cyclo-ligase [uncultured Eubacterium sp.]MCI6538369.1 5-formyltetrahydrofolate cyclo-ligase [Lachnospiraceae bacterium]
MTEKQQIRKKYKTLRNEMSSDEVREKSDQICKNIISSEVFQKAEKILAYAPLGNEADIRFAIEAGWKQNKRIAFPKVFGDTMKYFEVSDFSELEEGTFHVMEPKEERPADWADALVLVPGVAFDRKKKRMGYGKGYYDRYFAGKADCVKLGIAYELQVAEQLPTEENDLPMEYLVTEKSLW